jgi:osmotically-inducible protein OsmY
LASSTLACNRAETKDQARQAAAEVRTAAARAGEELADGWVTTKVQARYFSDREIKGRHIDVNTRDGIVTLNGYVPSEDARRRAVEIAKSTEGVKQVTDQLGIGQANATVARDSSPKTDTVATSGGAERTAEHAVERVDDARITATIQAKYFLDNGVKGRNINVDSRDGVVTLRGEVGSETERGQALLLARNTDGVQRVEDNLTVNAAVDADATGSSPASAGSQETLPAQLGDGVITTKIKAKFVGDGQVKATNIDVTTNNGVVTLDGTVPSGTAKQKALALARDTDGVTQVIDRLTVQRAR